MSEKENIAAYQIKVNRIASEGEKFIPYSKYIKNEYPQLDKVVPKHSILYKAKIRPEIVINEYHQTSNNFNTNINIKTNQSECLNDNYFNTDIKDLDYIRSCRNSDIMNRNFYTENPTKYAGLINKMNLSGKYKYKKKIDINNSETFSSNLSGNFNNQELDFKTNDLNKKEHKLINSYIVHSPNDSYKNNSNYNTNIINDINDLKMNDSFLYNKFSNKTSKIKKVNNNKYLNKNTFSSYNSLKYNKYFRHKNLSIGFIDAFNNNKVNTEGPETSTELKTNGVKNDTNNNNQNQMDFYPKRKMKKYLTDKINNKDPSILKMEIYRVKLFKEFYKYFQKYFKSKIKPHLIHFIEKLKEKKIRNADSKSSFNYYIAKKRNSSNIKNEINSTEFKSATIKDYCQVIEEFNQQSNNNDIKNFRTINNDTNNSSLSNVLKNKNIFLNNTQRNSCSGINNLKKKIREEYANSAPLCFIERKTVNLSENINYENNNQKINELYRDSKELNKKYEQIQRRRKKSHTLNLNSKLGKMSCNSSVESHKIKSSEESNELNEIKRYIQEMKKHKNSNNLSNEKKKNLNLNKLSKKEKTNNNIKEEIKNKDIVFQNNNNIINNKKNIINSNHIKKYKLVKVNINQNLINKPSKDKNNNFKVIYYKIHNNHKNIIYYSKKRKTVHPLQSLIIKNITTKDKLINIHINYYFMVRKFKPSYMRYNSLKQAKNFSVTILGVDYMDKNELKLNFKLSSILEEDISIQNSKIYDDSDTLHILDSKKYLQFFEIFNNLILRKYKKNFMYNMKTIQLVYKINDIFINKKEEINDKYCPNKDINNKNYKMNKNRKIYSKKRGIKINKLEDNINLHINKNESNKHYNTIKSKIDSLRYRLIKYSLFYCKNNN
jgi:hypothetical protein